MQGGFFCLNLNSRMHFHTQKVTKYTQEIKPVKICVILHTKQNIKTEEIYMSFSFGLRDLADPMKRLVMGALLLALGIFCQIGKDWYQGVDRSTCTEVEATFDDCKYRSVDGAVDANSIYLTFEDYSRDVDVHSSCADDELTQRLMELKSGTKMKLLVHEKTNLVYEIKVNGETWLDFDEARNEIKKNNNVITIVGYVMLGIGAIFAVSGVVPMFFGKPLKDEEDAT